MIHPNHGDRDLNRRICMKHGYSEFYSQIAADFKANPRHYTVFNLSAEIDPSLRISTNLFQENGKYIQFY